MSETPDDRYEQLLRNYRDLTKAIRMIRVAIEETFGEGLLPSAAVALPTPVDECEAIARAIYAAGTPKSKSQ
jgi:hypothetical protein